MSASDGPWGSRNGAPAPVSAHAAPTSVPETTTTAAQPLDKGQHPAWALISTVLLGGFIWYVSGSWVVAVAALWGLLVHEYGHVLAMNRYGMGPAKIYIVPFLGGMARSQRLPSSEWDGVKVSLAGPAFGLLAAIPLFVGWFFLGGAAWLIGAFAIAIINLVNLAPAPPLDGSKALGPVLARIHPMLEKAAMVAVGAVVVVWGVSNGNWPFAALLALALFGHLRRGVWRPEGRQLTGRESVMSVGLFVVTALACAGVALAALMPMAGSLDGALAHGAGFLRFGR